MDRQITYPGEVITDTKLLLMQKNAMLGIGHLARAVLGPGPTVDGLACAPTSPASLSVTVGTGSLYALEDVDATAYGSLGADTTDLVVKQGLNTQVQTLTCAAPTTAGQSITYLIEAAYLDEDTGNQVLTYFNSANPSQPFTGPNNTGTAMPTVRQGICNIQIKAGTPATTGSQTAPAADSGYTGLYTVTIAYGQTTITSANIATLSSAPFVATKLGAVPAAIQAQAGNYALDTGTTNAYAISLSPAPTLTAGMPVRFKASTTNTGASTIAINGAPGIALVHADGSALIANDIVTGQIVEGFYEATSGTLQIVTMTPSGAAQCYFSYVSASQCLLSPYGGNKLMINGKLQTIPSGGVSLAPTGLTAATLYYVYAFMSGTTMTLEAVTTAYTLSAATGMPIKTGDATRTLVGMVYPATGPVFSYAINSRYVSSYWNRRLCLSATNGAQSASTGATSPIELNTNIRAALLNWAEEGTVYIAAICNVSGAATNTICSTSIAVDNATPITALTSSQTYAATATSNNFTGAGDYNLTEGVHYVTMVGSSSSGTSGFTNCCVSVLYRG